MTTLEASWIQDERMERRERSLKYLAAFGGFLVIFFLLRLAVQIAGAVPPPQRNVLPPASSTPGPALAWTNCCVTPPGRLNSDPSGLTVLVRQSATATLSGRTPMVLTGTRAVMVTVYFPTNEPPRQITFQPSAL